MVDIWPPRDTQGQTLFSQVTDMGMGKWIAVYCARNAIDPAYPVSFSYGHYNEAVRNGIIFL